jgi:hypothetical protein
MLKFLYLYCLFYTVDIVKKYVFVCYNQGPVRCKQEQIKLN